MQSVLTSEFLDIVPASIRERLQLKPGLVMEFDEAAPFLKAVPAPLPDGVDFQEWLTKSVGLAKGRLTTDERMLETRGED